MAIPSTCFIPGGREAFLLHDYSTEDDVPQAEGPNPWSLEHDPDQAARGSSGEAPQRRNDSCVAQPAGVQG